MDKWETLRNLMKADISHAVHYSSDRDYEHGVTKRYLKYMDELDVREQKENKISDALEVVNQLHGETLKKLSDNNKGFYYTGVPDFDKKTWEKMLDNLEGLS